jgi:L-rhamnose isomerase / sugar isomerase
LDEREKAMMISGEQIQDDNHRLGDHHKEEYRQLTGLLNHKGKNPNLSSRHLSDFQIAIPSWALGAGGTRFGRFSIGGEPRNLQEKIEDVGLLHALNRSSGAISLHIPWDIPKDPEAIKQKAVKPGYPV